MFCPKCGTKQEDESRFCHNCGADLSEYLDLEDNGEELEETAENIENNNAESRGAANEDDIKKAEKGSNKKTKEKSKSNGAVKPKTKEKKAAKKASDEVDAYVQPKKKAPTKGIVAIAIIAAIAAGASFAVKYFAGNISKGDSYVFLKEDTYYLTDNLAKDNEIEIGSVDEDYPVDRMVRFSPDGKYVYFFTNIVDGVGSLRRAEVGKLKKDSSNNDKYIETIASDVEMYTGFRFMKGGSVIYRKEEGGLYCYDGKESKKIGKNVGEFYTDKDSKIVYTVEKETYDEEDEYIYTSDLYGVDIKDIESGKKLAKDVSYIINADDLDHIFFVKDEAGENSSLYVTGVNNEETTKICSEAKNYEYSDGALFYLAPNGNTLKLSDYVKDSGNDDIYFEYLRDDIDMEEPEEVCNLCVFRDGKETVIAENVVNASFGEGMIAYNTPDIITDKVSIDEIEEAYEARSVFDLDFAKALYVNTEKTNETIQLSDNAAAKLLESEDTYWNIYVKGSRVYVARDGELFEAKIEGNQISDAISLGEGYIIGSDDSNLYFSEYGDSELADVYIITDGEKKKLATGVEMIFLDLYEDGTLFGYTDYNYDNAYGDLEMFDSNGKSTKIGADVSKYIRKGKNDILFISDDSLFSFDGKEKKQLKNDVSYVWCSNYEKDTGAIHRLNSY